MATSQDSPSLQAAAELLVKAAVDQTHATSIALSREAVGELKRVAAFTQAAAEKLDNLKKLANLDAVLAKLEKLDHLARLDEVLKAVSDGNNTAVIQTLQWAIDHTSIGKFDFYGWGGSTYSSDMVRDVIECFLRGAGSWISNDSYSDCQSRDEKGREAFRAKLSRQIQTLTGVKPRIVKGMNGQTEQWIIYRV